MKELNLSSFIQTMQEGLVKHYRQEEAGRFLLEAVTMQENASCETDLGSKKISRLVSRLDPVPSDIKQAALKPDIAEGVKEYFRKEVLPDMNPYTKDDVLQKLMTIVTNDAEIALRQKNELQKLYDDMDDVEFLYKVFMYVLQRNNKKSSVVVDYQDIPLLAETNYRCPLQGVELVETVKGKPVQRYTITQIFPEGLPKDISASFSAVHPKPKNLYDPSNLIALSEKASKDYLSNPTVDEYERLYDIKQSLHQKYEAINAVNRIELESEIRTVIESVIEVDDPNSLPMLEYDAVRVGEKIKETSLKDDVEKKAVHFYRYIESLFREMADSFDVIAGEIKLSSQKLEKTGLSQEDVYFSLTEWIHNKAFPGNPDGKVACMIVVSFFIQNCEVFHK